MAPKPKGEHWQELRCECGEFIAWVRVQPVTAYCGKCLKAEMEHRNGWRELRLSLPA
jgi:hypothetical protein